jgi:hypothetical protein
MEVFCYGKKKNNEDFVINSFQDNQRKSCGLPTDRPTDISKQYTPSSSKGGEYNVVHKTDISSLFCIQIKLHDLKYYKS